jgi:rfaE bifunctional protein nucleotidyltransferase chain/domain
MRPSYGSKIKTVEQCIEAIGPRPRQRSVIMCHGAFDIVHPGHLRHLMYAKEKADVLVASITTDEYITKAEHRPFVPQELRAHSLAALEMVDYVIVDPNPTPIQTIRRLQPDYFAKGYEYFANGVPPKTQEEMDTLAEYGGEMVFTPGDVVYSSSALIEASPPQLGLEKLLALLESEGLDFDDLRRVVHSLSGLRIHVIGDTIVDSYSYCSLSAPRPSRPPSASSTTRPSASAAGRPWSPSTCAWPAPTSPCQPCSATTSCVASSSSTWPRLASTACRSSTRRGPPHTRSASSPTATSCSRSTASTTARCPTAS